MNRRLFTLCALALISLCAVSSAKASLLFYATYNNTQFGGNAPSGGVLKVDSSGVATDWDINWGASPVSFDYPMGIATDRSGNVYVNDGWNIYKIDPAGNGSIFATKQSEYYNYGITVDSSGNVYAVGGGKSGDGTTFYSIYSYNSSGEAIGHWVYSYGDSFSGLAIGPNGTLYGTDSMANWVYSLNLTTGAKTQHLSVTTASDLTFDAAGNLYVLGSVNGYLDRLYKFDLDLVGSEAVSTNLLSGGAIAFDAASNLYFSNEKWDEVNEIQINEIRIKTPLDDATTSTVFTTLTEYQTVRGIAMAVPEPSTWALLGMGVIVALIGFMRKRSQRFFVAR